MPQVQIAELGSIGLAPDAIPQDLPPNAWTGGRNVVFRDGTVQRVRGHVQFSNTPAVTPYYVTPYQTATARFWVHAGTAAVYADDGATLTDITGTAPTGTAADRWSGGTLNGVLVMNNGVDVPTFWGGDTGVNLATLTGWDANWRAACIRPWRNQLVALDVTKSGTRYPHMVKLSASAVPGAIPTSWDEAAAAVDTYETDLAETPDKIIDAMPMGDLLIVYKERSRYALQYIGFPDVIRPQRMPGEVGMLARGCGVQTPMGHVVLAPGDVVIHSGQETRSILTGKYRRMLFATLDSTNYARSFVTANPERAEVWICYPEAGQTNCTRAIIWNWESNTLGTRDLDNATYGAFGQINYTAGNTWDVDADSWDSDSSAWDADEYAQTSARLLLSQSAPLIALADSGSTFAGTDFASYVEKSGMTFGEPDRVKLLRSITPRIEAPSGTVLTFTVGAAMDAEQAPTIQGTATYTVGTTRKADVFASGRFLYLKIGSTSGAPWRLMSLSADVEPMGEF